MNFIPFEQWLKDNPDLVEQVQQESDDCDVCQGEGYCFTCGATCEHCDGDGQRKTLRKMYDAMKDEQIKKLKEWQDMLRGAV